jgi:hypothetical protein
MTSAPNTPPHIRQAHSADAEQTEFNGSLQHRLIELIVDGR